MGPPVGGVTVGAQVATAPTMGTPTLPPPPEHGPHADSPVLMAYGLDQSKMNCDQVFSVFCLYSNAEKVKFMKSKPGTAVVEMATLWTGPLPTSTTISCLDRSRMSVSKQPGIIPGQSCGLEVRSCSYTDFSESRTIGSHPGAGSQEPHPAPQNRIQHPSNVLRFFNAPREVAEMSDVLGVKRPSSGKVFLGKSGRSCSGLLEWEPQSDALATPGTTAR